MKKQTQYTIEMDSQLAAQMWEVLTRNFDIEIRSRRHSEDGSNQFVHVVAKSQKADLPKRSDYMGAISWLKAVRDCIGENFIFALDEALMCQGSFLGRNDEAIVWGYGDDSASQFNGVVLLDNQISSDAVIEKHGLRYTDFNRTLTDALANETILDMQGITEALSHYYYTHGNSFEGIAVNPEYADLFAKLADDAIAYYDS